LTANQRLRGFHKNLRRPGKAAIFAPMHFSTYIALLHSTFSLLAALLLRGAR
jgi:hypothetical protein